MNDFATLEKTIVRELSCRLCLCNDVIKLKPLSAEVKRKIKKLYDIVIHTDDCLPKAICHDCLQQISNAYIYAVKVERTQKFLEFHRNKKNEDKQPNEIKNYSLINELSARNLEHASTELKTVSNSTTPPKPAEITTTELQQGDTKLAKPKQVKKQSPSDMKYLEAMPLEEFAEVEKSLMKHYKDRHGVPGYVTCCDKKFHYFYPKKIIEHMAFHLQPNIFMCKSCHQNFQTSQELTEHQTNGGRSEGKILCPRCSERYPTYRELGAHLLTHRADKLQCDYCGKTLKHHHRKKTVNHMEDVILCSQCVRTLKNIEKQERDIKEKVKAKSVDTLTLQKYQKFRQAMGLSADEEASSD
ncbi:zinc finger protein 461-like isoform X2 [Pieris brassicae]|uniref:zinc finger protein 461-like isoform X2 n=1 Tax=Pieris brassicae TaxID=7116 RepID=UPI001E661A21|nr:zinc finger protein 461-like isoform X2 [Pieris brassicae]